VVHAPPPPITLVPTATSTQNIAFRPVAVGADPGSVAFSGTGVVRQSILLSGAAVQSTTTTVLTSNINPAFITQAVTFIATVVPAGTGTPTQTVTFYDGATAISPAVPLSSGVATFTTSTLAAGPHSITAIYSGDTNFVTSTSAVLTQYILDFNFTLSSTGPTATTQTVIPGASAIFNFNLLPIGGPFTFPVTLSATGLPPGATATFTPNPVNIGSSPASFTMTIQTAKPIGALHRTGDFGGGTIAFALLLLPFSARFRRHARRMKRLSLYGCMMLLSFALIAGLAGCGTDSGFFGEAQQTYTINVIGTATGTGAVVLQHSTTVTLIVQ